MGRFTLVASFMDKPLNRATLRFARLASPTCVFDETRFERSENGEAVEVKLFGFLKINFRHGELGCRGTQIPCRLGFVVFRLWSHFGWRETPVDRASPVYHRFSMTTRL